MSFLCPFYVLCCIISCHVVLCRLFCFVIPSSSFPFIPSLSLFFSFVSHHRCVKRHTTNSSIATESADLEAMYRKEGEGHIYETGDVVLLSRMHSDGLIEPGLRRHTETDMSLLRDAVHPIDPLGTHVPVLKPTRIHTPRRHRFVVLDTPLRSSLRHVVHHASSRPKAALDTKRIVLSILIQRVALCLLVLTLVVNIVRLLVLPHGMLFFESPH